MIKYTIQTGDTLDNIAYKFYNDSNLYKYILIQNPYLSIGFNGRLPVGTTIEIPDLASLPNDNISSSIYE